MKQHILTNTEDSIDLANKTYSKFAAKSANYQDLLKILALVTMVIDHLGFFFFPEQEWMRIIGRFTMPVFCFFAGYNFKKPHGLILLYGALLYMITTLVFYSFITTNILIPIFLGQVYLWFTKASFKNFYTNYCHVIFLALLWPFTKDYLDYGTLTIALMALGYSVQKDPNQMKIMAFIAVVLSLFHTFAVFDPVYNFTIGYKIAVVAVAIIEYMLFIAVDPATPVAWDIKPISRNMLFIYFAHLAVFQIIFFAMYF